MLNLLTAVLILCLSFAAAALGTYMLIRLVRWPGTWRPPAGLLKFVPSSAGLPGSTPEILSEPRVARTGQRSRIEERLGDLLRQGGLTLNPGHLLAAIIWAATMLGLVSFLALVVSGAGSSLGVFLSLLLLSGLGLTGIVLAVAGFARGRRMRLLESQLPDALEVIQSALKAGQPFLAALTLSSNEVAEPLRSELRRTADEIRYGGDVQTAFWRLAVRTGLADFRYLATGVAASLDAGTSLVKLLSDTSQVIRSREVLRKKVRSLSSESELSARMMMLMPVVFVGGVSFFNPGYYGEYVTDPGFLRAAAFFFILYVIGAFWLQSIVKNGFRGI